MSDRGDPTPSDLDDSPPGNPVADLTEPDSVGLPPKPHVFEDPHIFEPDLAQNQEPDAVARESWPATVIEETTQPTALIRKYIVSLPDGSEVEGITRNQDPSTQFNTGDEVACFLGNQPDEYVLIGHNKEAAPSKGARSIYVGSHVGWPGFPMSQDYNNDSASFGGDGAILLPGVYMAHLSTYLYGDGSSVQALWNETILRLLWNDIFSRIFCVDSIHQILTGCDMYYNYPSGPDGVCENDNEVVRSTAAGTCVVIGPATPQWTSEHFKHPAFTGAQGTGINYETSLTIEKVNVL